MEVHHEAPIAHTQSSSKDSEAQDIGDDYEIPPPEPSTSFAGLKDRIKRHYEICSDYYYSLWYVRVECSRYRIPRREAFANEQG